MGAINDPAVCAEVAAAHEIYEAALVGNDVETLDRMFWRSPDAVRFGVNESLHGFDEVAAFRRARPAIDLSRTVSNFHVVAFGSDLAITTIEFDRCIAGAAKHGRQTQVWRRFDDGWKIVSAHVSFAWRPESYVDAVSQLIGLPIPPEHRSGVELNIVRAGAIAKPLLAFELPDTVEMAGVFRP